ncbi:MAG TPA: hypothetical protein VGN06_07810 [Gaiellaceae bacterium]
MTVSKRVMLVFAAAAAAAFIAAPAGNAGLLSCPGSLQPFAQFGDYSDYFGFANNGFENGTSGWTVSGASVTSGNEPWDVNGPGGNSLSIGPGGSAYSPRVCTALLAPAWRMFAKSNGANGSLRAQIVFYGLLGNITGILNVTNFGSSSYGSWEPSSNVPSLLSLPLATFSAQLRLTNTGSSGTWQVDDVFVDPWGNRNTA